MAQVSVGALLPLKSADFQEDPLNILAVANDADPFVAVSSLVDVV